MQTECSIQPPTQSELDYLKSIGEYGWLLALLIPSEHKTEACWRLITEVEATELRGLGQAHAEVASYIEAVTTLGHPLVRGDWSNAHRIAYHAAVSKHSALLSQQQTVVNETGAV